MLCFPHPRRTKVKPDYIKAGGVLILPGEFVDHRDWQGRKQGTFSGETGIS